MSLHFTRGFTRFYLLYLQAPSKFITLLIICAYIIKCNGNEICAYRNRIVIAVLEIHVAERLLLHNGDLVSNNLFLIIEGLISKWSLKLTMTEISWDRGWDTHWFGNFWRACSELFVHSDPWHQVQDIMAGAANMLPASFG